MEYRGRERFRHLEETWPIVTTRSLRRPALWTLAICAMVLMLLVPAALRAQVGSADVLGTVTDPSGALVPNAKVTIKDLGTAAERSTTTNAKGEYIFTTLPNSTYRLTVEAKGFKAYTVVSFPLSTGDRARYDVSLQTGAVTEKVEVTGEVAALQTDSSTVSSTIQDKLVQELPLNNRQFITALQIQPGLNAGPRSGASTAGSPQDRRPDADVAANGQLSVLNNRMVDGFDNNDRLNGLIGLQPSIDGIAEVRVDTSTYRAEYGRTAGAVINVVTKGGTNNFHGSAYDYFRNDILDSSSYSFLGLHSPKPKYRQNNFGGSLGGPIWKDKTFFFFDLEEGRVIRGQTFTTHVPTAFERANPGNFTDYGGPNLITCTDAQGNPLVLPPWATCALNPIMTEYFNLFPPSQEDINGVGFRVDSPSGTQNSRTWDLRVDHRFSAKDLFFARYANNPVTTTIPEPWSKDPATGIYPGGSGIGFPGPSSTKSQNLQLNYVHIFSPALLLDLKAGYTRVNIQSFPWNYGKGASDKLGIPNAHIPGVPQTDGLMGVGGPTFEWDFLGDANSVPQVNRNNTFQYSGALTYTHGAHTFKFGGGLTRRQLAPWSDDFIAGFFVFAPTPPFGDDRANFLTGHAVVSLRGNAVIQPGYRSWEPYAYAQDDWRVTSKLTLNLGLRYDIFTPFTEVKGRYANYVPKTESFILGTQSPTTGVSTDHRNIAPRFGFAYSITPKTVLRGGFGISFFPPDIGMVAGGGGAGPTSIVNNPNPPYTFEFFSAGPAVFTQSLTGPVAPALVDLATWKTNPNVTLLSAKALGFSSAYAEQFNLALQREFGANTVSLNYVGVMGHQLLRTINAQTPDPPGANQPTPSVLYPDLLPAASCAPGPPGPPPPPSACVAGINYSYNGAASNYSAMQLVFARRFVKGLTVNANWTWAHGLDDTSGGVSGVTVPSNPKFDYGNSTADIRHRVAVVGSYELPFAKNSHGIVGVMLKSWQATSLFYWQTGLPFTVDSRATAPNGLAYTNQPGVTVDRPDVVGKVALGNPSLHGWFNTDAFTPQTQGTVSNQKPNQFRGPRDRRADLAISKIFPLTERFKLQFRAECFNISNTPNFSIGSNTTVGAWTLDPVLGRLVPTTAGQTLGLITDTAANENPRQFQFALKLQF